MDVNVVITHLENFANTWKGWGDFLGGLVKFFGEGGVLKSIEAWQGAGDALKGLFGTAEK